MKTLNHFRGINLLLPIVLDSIQVILQGSLEPGVHSGAKRSY